MKRYCIDCLGWSCLETVRNIKFGRCSGDNKFKNSHFECDLPENFKEKELNGSLDQRSN